MDCRRLVALGVSVALSAAGCLPLKTVQTQPAPDRPLVEITPRDESKETKRSPKPKTVVAMAKVHETGATDPKRPREERDVHFDRARRCYQEALRQDPNNLQALAGQARLWAGRQDFARAVTCYQTAVQAHPKEAALWFELGMCQARLKEWDAGITSLKTAAQLDPLNRKYAHALGFALARVGRYDEALTAFQPVDSPAEAHYNLARMLHHVGQGEMCKLHLRAAISANPHLIQARELLAHLENPTPAAAPIKDEALIPASFEEQTATPAPAAPPTPVADAAPASEEAGEEGSEQ
jgi:tetratricopeptide (TPR) repeat protein